MTEAAVAAHAKINLHLNVVSRRDDGYHDIVSLFQAVSLRDLLRLRASGVRDAVRLSGSFDVPAGENLIVRAVEAFRRETGIRGGVEIEVEKRIPLGAGFGGGSSDAAAALRCLAALFGAEISGETLRRLGASLGSDVPFFLPGSGAAAVVEGRGDRITGVDPRDDYGIVAITPARPVETALAYDLLDARWASRPARGLSVSEVVRMYRSNPPAQWDFINSFDEPVMAHRPDIAAVRSLLVERGALAARLTGSGSTVIGLFGDRQEARDCAAALGAGPLCAGGARIAALDPLASLPAVW
ncbi:MAG TPA: 4-(cytidine 5'-diphospho)-2-C-methyl-D-erythritol kinase [Spirochaetia bacterium]|nr:4-(cytidine 5'-diphospho)-2-C-methyl-D-erythritol kinase [Spirochaetia bacterium]